jgi:uncharacterized protein YydD (DUF2326 family)
MPGVERKVTQPDADVHAIYDMVDDVRKDVRTVRGSVLRQGVRLDQIEADLQEIADKQGEHGRRLDEILAILKAE